MLTDVVILMVLSVLLLGLHRFPMLGGGIERLAVRTFVRPLLHPVFWFRNPYLRLLALVVLLDLSAWGALVAQRGPQAALAALSIGEDEQVKKALKEGVPEYWTWVCYQAQASTYRALTDHLMNALQDDLWPPTLGEDQRLLKQREFLHERAGPLMLRACAKGGRFKIDAEGFLRCSKHGRNDKLPRLLPFAAK